MKGKTLKQAFVALTIAMATACTDTSGAHSPKPQAKRATQAANEEVRSLNIRMTIDDQTITATLEDNATSRDFVSLLPLTLTLEDYASTEKIAYLPKKLTREGAPKDIEPKVGDITYYAPWGNLAIFHKDFGYSDGLVKLGAIQSGIEALRRAGSLRATIEVVPQ